MCAHASEEHNKAASSTWEEQEEFLEFLSGVQGEVARISGELGADFRYEISPPESIDGDEGAPHTFSFFISLRKGAFPGAAHCLYARLERSALRAFAGRYDAGRVHTIKELAPMESLKDPDEALRGWLRELMWLSLGQRPENA
jgi:hypothetical protein